MAFFTSVCSGIIACCPLVALASNSAEEVFTKIYKQSTWGKNEFGEGSSGPGSRLDTTEQYRSFIQHFLATFQIRSVVDAGCGDWEFSKAIDWSGIAHRLRCCPVGGRKNQRQFGCPHIRFLHQDIIAEPLPSADLLICKDVLQHLPNADVLTFMKQLPNFKYCLITNDVNPKTLLAPNLDIRRGDYRLLDLTLPPFNRKGIKVFHFVSIDSFVKQVLLISREGGEIDQNLLEQVMRHDGI